MTKLPFMQFYPSDWIQDTQGLSLEAKGAWITLLCQMWIAPVRGVVIASEKVVKHLFGVQEDAKLTNILAELDTVADIEQHEMGGEVVNFKFTSRRIVRDEAKRNEELTRKRRYDDKNPTRHRRSSDANPTHRSQKSEVISQKEEKIKDPVKPPADPVDKLKEKEKAERAWARDLHAMWEQVKQMAKRQPERFDKALGAWIVAMLRKKWEPTEINAALMDFVKFEDSNSQIAEWYPYLNAILQKTRTKKVQGESEQHKDYDAKSMSDILDGMGIRKGST